MATVTLKGNPVQTIGELPIIGEAAPDFSLTTTDLQSVTLKDYAGTKLVLNIFPSVDTGTCAASVRKFNQEVASLSNTKVLCISKDLPFAQARFCGAEGIENVEMLSAYKNNVFAKDYQLLITSGPLDGLLSRCIIVIDETGKVTYTEQVSEIVDEPNYDNTLAALA